MLLKKEDQYTFDVTAEQVEGIGSQPTDGLPVLTSEHTRFIGLMETRVQAALEWAKNLIVTDQASLNMATGNLGIMKKVKAQLDRRRKDLLAPILERKASIHNPFKSLIDQIDAATKVVDGAVTRYMIEEEKRQRAAAEEALRREREEAVARQKECEEQALLNESEQALDDAIAAEEQIKEIDNTKITTEIRGRGAFGSASITRRVSNDLITEAIKQGVRKIPGVKIYKVWTFMVTDPKQVPDDYKSVSTTSRR